ncbi:MAG: efflux RND transporter periplasmic adaptor subunit, partial [Deltaproteobacteria bacterium]|nr:efflux RND transporter periplasmic adaptor subunit [Deltaproteobacteria bacterium]
MNAEGLARQHNLVLPLIALIVVLLAGCHSGPSLSEDEGAEPAAIMMAVSGAKVAVKPMRSELRLLGETVAHRHISLRAPAAGRVIGLDIQTGDRVKRGEVVAHLLSREVEAAENGLALARQIDPADAPSLTESVKRYAHGAGVPVTIPEDAIVAQRLVSPGQMVADLEQLADLIDPRSIFVNAAVPVDDLARIRPGMKAIVTSPLYPGLDFPAQVAGISPSFSQAGATSPARLEFSGHERIYESGAPVEVTITIKSVPNAIVIPAAALFEDAADDRFYIFVVGEDGRMHRKTVTTGIRSPTEVQITSGVRDGQIVITSGGYALSDGVKVRVRLPN